MQVAGAGRDVHEEFVGIFVFLASTPQFPINL
jgi:hypothetical protein